MSPEKVLASAFIPRFDFELIKWSHDLGAPLAALPYSWVILPAARGKAEAD
jgi:hypothetical protein